MIHPKLLQGFIVLVFLTNTTLIEFELTQEDIFSTYESSMGNTAPNFRDAVRIEQILSIDYFAEPGSR